MEAVRGLILLKHKQARSGPKNLTTEHDQDLRASNMIKTFKTSNMSKTPDTLKTQDLDGHTRRPDVGNDGDGGGGGDGVGGGSVGGGSVGGGSDGGGGGGGGDDSVGGGSGVVGLVVMVVVEVGGG
ncbi:glycine-rich cell wall structural protein 1-like [Bombus pyrosoma]|uniref:glycine-rich cell wall structural protein 1-like n=1 Tax=Bombus pyrosoma TaxID=396416 RepID=UPI001CB9AE70|nr:glycine-rich cell wall structural protein 1-like [Bombus pyrosoma]